MRLSKVRGTLLVFVLVACFSLTPMSGVNAAAVNHSHPSSLNRPYTTCQPESWSGNATSIPTNEGQIVAVLYVYYVYDSNTQLCWFNTAVSEMSTQLNESGVANASIAFSGQHTYGTAYTVYSAPYWKIYTFGPNAEEAATCGQNITGYVTFYNNGHLYTASVTAWVPCSYYP